MSARRAGGVSLIELVVFIVIVGIGMAGIFAVFNVMTAGSADPQVRKQVLAIAESLLDEVMLMPFTYCDPDDANAATATSATVGAGTTNCASAAEVAATAVGDPSTADALPAAETRYSAGAPFDNVNDYHGFSMSGIRDLGNVAVAGLEGYTANITVTQAGLGPGTPSDPHDTIPAAAALRIAVTVKNVAANVEVTLEGYRTRYSPSTLP
jgi:MSHA pilin protein MshD